MHRNISIYMQKDFHLNLSKVLSILYCMVHLHFITVECKNNRNFFIGVSLTFKIGVAQTASLQFFIYFLQQVTSDIILQNEMFPKQP